MPSSKKIRDFRAVVWKYYRIQGRHDLPWRKTKNPYRILVSEVMLQQTQVPRVLEKYKEFLKQFPTVYVLAKASLADVLKVWSGLGYNRRGKYLHDAAKIIIEKHRKFPREYEALRKLPGVGEYTAHAVRTFAFNERDVFIETNIRTTFIHHFFSYPSILIDRQGLGDIGDSAILPLVGEAAKKQDPREWHYALMDYGTYLKKIGVRNNHRSAHYTKQSKFEGSLRQVRGAILRALHAGERIEKLPFAKKKIESALASLTRDGLILKKQRRWTFGTM